VNKGVTHGNALSQTRRAVAHFDKHPVSVSVPLTEAEAGGHRHT